MKLPKYEDVLRMSEEEVNETLIPARTERAKKQAELELAKLDEEIATKEANIVEECSDEEVDFAEIIRMQDDLALAARKRGQYKVILDEMFPAE